MSGTDSFPETADEPHPPVSPFTRGIEPANSGYGPPPPPDFGVIVPRQADYPHATVDYGTEPVSGTSGTAPQRSSRPWALAAISVSIVVLVAVVFGLVVVGIGSLVSLTGDRGDAAPSSETRDSGQSAPDDGAGDPAPGSGSVESSLQATIDEYKSARDNGSLWTTIPDSDFNRTAVSAFLYLLTDLKLAASFGADTSDYLARADELEQKLLNQEPLGSDISITLSDRTFTYDGDTGEGGYTNN